METNTNTNQLSNEEKIRLLKIEMDDNIDNTEFIDSLFKIYTNKNLAIRKQLDKNNKKYKILLKVLNKILEEAGKNPIDDIYDFKDLTKAELLKCADANRLFGWDKEVFNKKAGCYDPQKCNWYIRDKMDTYIMTFIRKACEEFGLEFKYVNRRKFTNLQPIYTYYYYIG